MNQFIIFLVSLTTSLAVLVKDLSSEAKSFSAIFKIFLAFSWLGFNPSKAKFFKKLKFESVLTLVKAKGPVEGLNKVFADDGLISFERWQNVL